MSTTTTPGQGLTEGRSAIVSGFGPGLGRDNALARNGARFALRAGPGVRLGEAAAELDVNGGESIPG